MSIFEFSRKHPLLGQQRTPPSGGWNPNGWRSSSRNYTLLWMGMADFREFVPTEKILILDRPGPVSDFVLDREASFGPSPTESDVFGPHLARNRHHSMLVPTKLTTITCVGWTSRTMGTDTPPIG
ncbi:hypothetical protein R3P38DRAFT_3197366 [Favolaschia claudopus]|uniref:Uncharacterized protein n=1 Tax=Favolaschia claudopus TaxID=2862362 RepID=A0AAW0B473_9AGAR